MTEVEKMRRLSPLFSRSAMNRSSMVSWLSVPEFADAVLEEMYQRTFIDDRFLVELMERLWPEMEAGKIACPSFKNCRRGINQLRRAVEEQSKQPV